MRHAIARLDLIAPAVGLLVAPMPALSATVTDTYQDVEATLSAPDAAGSGQDFDLDVLGVPLAGESEITAYELYEDADWSYDAGHRVVVTAGTQLDADGFHFGSHAATYTLNRPAGTYRYTYVFGDRMSGHSWYDLAVELEVRVIDDCSAPGPPEGLVLLGVTRDKLAWDSVDGAEGYDVVAGDLAVARADGEAGGAVTDCLADDWPALSLDRADAARADRFYLVRAVNCAGPGSHDSGSPAQLGSRDPGLGLSAFACP